MASYWRDTRTPRYSLLFALPLLALYELLARLVTADSGIRNGADVLLKSLFLLLGGRHGLTLFAVVVLGTGLVLVIRDWRKSGAPAGGYFVGMFAESAVYAACFGAITSLLTGLLLHGPASLAVVQGKDLGLPTELVVSLGAGIYEELLFRVVLVGLLARLALAGFGWRPWVAGAFATVVGAVIFSAFHYIGPLGDTLELGSFTFRMVAGLLLSGLFLARGFGIAAWTHALYDVFLTLRGGF
ncbi:MAG TPA: CPBP family intramembrane metalloprotease [Gemmatimonadales bacterium]|nr:CPBP family intramembrane metalloprotease [Gemmatimonadales bacterium]